MPRLGTVSDHSCRAADRLADIAVVDQTAAGLKTGAEEGVGRAAEHEPFLVRELDQLESFVELGGKRLLRVDVLAGEQRGARHLVVVSRTCNIQNDIDVRVGKKLIHIVVNFRYRVVLRGVLRLFADEVADSDNLNFAEQLSDVFEVDAADASDTDKTDFECFHFDLPSFMIYLTPLLHSARFCGIIIVTT